MESLKPPRDSGRTALRCRSVPARPEVRDWSAGGAPEGSVSIPGRPTVCQAPTPNTGPHPSRIVGTCGQMVTYETIT